jgi:hypothetical protein
VGKGEPQAQEREARTGGKEGSMTGDKDRQEQAEQAVEQLLDGYSKLVAMATGAVGMKQKLRRLGGKTRY